MQRMPSNRLPMAPMQQSGGLKDIDFEYYIGHYLDLAKRWWPYILISGPVAAVLMGLVGLHLGMHDSPAQEVSALIGVENTSSMSGVSDVAEGAYRVEMIRSRSFLREVVDKLSLRLVVHEIARHSVFDSVSIDSTTPPGKYDLLVVKKNGVYELRYSGGKDAADDRVIATGPLGSLDRLSVAGAYLRLSREYLEDPYGFSFAVVSTRAAVDRVLYSLDVRGPGRRHDYIRVSFRGRDYHLITETVNTIAEHYVAQNLSFRKRRTGEALAVLEKQLRKAQEQLAVSQGALRSFLSANPNVALSQGAQQTVTEIMDLERSTHLTSSVVTEAERLRDEYLAVPPQRRRPYISEIAIFLQTNGVASAQVLQTELQQLLQERADLERDFAPNHPAIQENNGKIGALGNRALASLNRFIESNRERTQQRRSGISRLSSQLRSLPTKELKLAELQRRQQIDSEIYSTILAKYNEIKVANSVEMADVFVMDQAVPPYGPSLPERAGKLLALCLLAGLAASFGPPVLVDMTDKTARTEKELRKMTDLPVIEVIPAMAGTEKGHA